MRIFLTGATGLIGSALIPELLASGHTVVGLTRSESGAQAIIAAGAEAYRGNIQDVDSLLPGVAKSDAVIHCAFEHDFSKFKENSETDKRAIDAFGEVLLGSDRPLLVSAGMPLNSPVVPVTEDTEIPAGSPTPRVSELTAISLADQGVNVRVIRLPQVHNTQKQGLVTSLIEIARQKGVSAYVGDGNNRWSACHVVDVARVYTLALNRGEPGARYHAVAEEGVSLRDIAKAVGQRLNLPVRSISASEADAHFGFFGKLVSRDLSASSALTQQRLGWNPTGPTLIDDMLEERLYR